MKIIASISKKLALNIDWDILFRIKAMLEGQYEKEKEILSSYTQKISEMFFEVK